MCVRVRMDECPVGMPHGMMSKGNIYRENYRIAERASQTEKKTHERCEFISMWGIYWYREGGGLVESGSGRGCVSTRLAM